MFANVSVILSILAKHPAKMNEKFNIVESARKQQLAFNTFYQESLHSSTKHKYTPDYIAAFGNRFISESCRSTIFWGETTVGRQAWIESTTSIMTNSGIMDDFRIEELEFNVVFSDDSVCGVEAKNKYYMDSTGDKFLTNLVLMVFRKEDGGENGLRCILYQETTETKQTGKPESMESLNEIADFNIVEAARKQIKSISQFYLETNFPEKRAQYTREFIVDHCQMFSESCKFIYCWGVSASSRTELIELLVGMLNDAPTFPNAHLETLSNEVIFETDLKCGLEVKESFILSEEMKVTCVASYVFVKDRAGPNGVRCIHYQETKDEANSKFKQRKLSVNQTERELEEADEILGQMEIELQSLAAPIRTKLQPRVRVYKDEVKKYKKELSKSLNEREQLLGRSSKGGSHVVDFEVESMDQRSRLLRGTERLQDGSRRLEESRRLALETGYTSHIRIFVAVFLKYLTEAIGISTLEDLNRQREQILRTRDTVG
ncbi:hypothetical protein HK098_004224 [Nowakowskiella sp. JEL0407]|nr:hypothetical protein HK098_004224 [Nowakowskiella sp. JEL0407]